MGVLPNCFLEVKCEVTALKAPKEAIVISPWFPGVLLAWGTFEVIFLRHPFVFLTRMVAVLFSFLLMIAPSPLFLEDRLSGQLVALATAAWQRLKQQAQELLLLLGENWKSYF